MQQNDADDYAGLPAEREPVDIGRTVLKSTEAYEILGNKYGFLSIRCKRCTSISHNPNDVMKLYCGRCHRFHVGENPGMGS